MPQATQTLSLSLAGTATVFNLAQRGVGLPTLWNRAIAVDGSVVAMETISHLIKRAQSNHQVKIEGRLPSLMVSDPKTVQHTIGSSTSFSIPLTATTAEVTRVCDLQIKAIEAFKAGIIAREAFF